jgi:hypothetical protein
VSVQSVTGLKNKNINQDVSTSGVSLSILIVFLSRDSKYVIPGCQNSSCDCKVTFKFSNLLEKEPCLHSIVFGYHILLKLGNKYRNLINMLKKGNVLIKYKLDNFDRYIERIQAISIRKNLKWGF